MRLLNELYTITKRQAQEGNYRVSIQLNPAHTIYACHFPGNPITPGVCTLQIVTELVEEVLQQRVQLKGYSNVKFLSILSPIESPEAIAELSITQAEEQIKVKATLRNEEKIFVKISAVYE